VLLSDFIVKTAGMAINEPARYLIGGHNGPYNDPETLVRNYSHWVITFSKCYEIKEDKKFMDKVKELSDYLISRDSRPQSHAFHHRNSLNRDKCNGLIGQAWTLEALARASSILGNTQYSEVAEDVFFQHKFNQEIGLWNRLEIDGKILSIDDTFNHQLWFAACAALLNTPRQDEISDRIFRFMNCLPENLSVLDNGLIYHPIERRLNQKDSRLSTKPRLRNIVRSLLPLSSKRKGQSRHNNKEFREKMIYKSIGYHQFNMYAFALLKESVPDHPFWQSFEFQQSINYLVSDEFKNGVSKNIYGFPYNPPGFEVPYALSVLSDLTSDDIIEISSWWVNEQLKRCYNPKTQMMDRNTEDPLTHTARVYELTRLPELYLDKIEIAI